MIIFEKVVEGVSQSGLARFARRAQTLAGVTGAVDVLIAADKRLQQLNRRFRKKNQPTDVLSFPRALTPARENRARRGPRALTPARENRARRGPRAEGGDIAISADIARKNARYYRHSTAQELKVLILHGMLHLAGHDHETDNGQMAKIESRLRAQLKLPATLIGRAQSREAKRRVAGTMR